MAEAAVPVVVRLARLDAKDRVSGYSHVVGLVFASVGASALVFRVGHRPGLLTSALVYAASLVLVYAASSAYHLASGRGALRRWLRKLDHCAIFLMIAGTCTPVFWCAFEGLARVAMLGSIWAIASGGIVLRMLWLSAPRTLYTLAYVAMGWLFVVQGPRGFHSLPSAALALVLAGGVTYTVGAVICALKRPNPFPTVFGFHEIWHVFVLVGSALHYAAIARLLAQ